MKTPFDPVNGRVDEHWPSEDPRLATLAAELGIPNDYPLRRGLPYYREASELVVAAIAPDDGSEVRLSPLAVAAWQRLEAAARVDDLKIWPLSGFRSVERQAAIIRAKLKQGQTISEILRLVAAPGYSEHHSGRALDVGAPGAAMLDESFAATAEFRWLERRASEFGFYLSYPRGNAFGIDYEPWHWCWWSATGRAYIGPSFGPQRGRTQRARRSRSTRSHLPAKRPPRSAAC